RPWRGQWAVRRVAPPLPRLRAVSPPGRLGAERRARRRERVAARVAGRHATPFRSARCAGGDLLLRAGGRRTTLGAPRRPRDGADRLAAVPLGPAADGSCECACRTGGRAAAGACTCRGRGRPVLDECRCGACVAERLVCGLPRRRCPTRGRAADRAGQVDARAARAPLRCPPYCRLCLSFAMAAELKPVYLITGGDRPKIQRALRRLRDRIGEEGVELLSADESGGEDAVAACNSMGLLGGGRRLVVVEDVERWKAADVKAVSTYLSSPAPDTVLALV